MGCGVAVAGGWACVVFLIFGLTTRNLVIKQIGVCACVDAAWMCD